MSDLVADDELLVDVEDGIMTVTLNRPDRLNALNHSMLLALAKAWDDARAREIRAVVITGAGRGFCSGFDVRGAVPPVGAITSQRARINAHVLSLAALTKPVLAAVNGVAAGAGLALASAADLRIASSEARFLPAFARIGVIPDAGATYFIRGLVGWTRAFDWLATSEELSADRAREWGLVSEVVAPDDLLARTRAKARQLADMPGDAVGLTKLLLQRSWASTLSEQLEHEAEIQPRALLAPGRAAARAEMVARLKRDEPSS